ncbi:uncharacterized protein [Nicotiana tomentosiformis]|uniref:uncharacterized protein n=1 Tax=Nicotiana tomentosiformis TaxID=4098 RepID=UPI00388CA226
MVNTRGNNLNREAAPIPDAALGGVPARPRGRPPKAARARTAPVLMAPRMVQELEEEVDEVPTPPPEPNHLEKTLTDIRKAMDTFAYHMDMQTQQNPQVGIQALQQGGMRAPAVKDMAQLAMKFVRLEPPVFIAYQLKDIANLWFKGVEKSRPEDAPLMIWAEFKKIFFKKWLPPGVRATLAILFETLKQDTVTVLEYSIKLEKLSRYAPHLILTEDEKIDRFDRGLILGIKKDTASGRRNTTFIDFVDIAMDLERIHQEERANREQNKKAQNFGTFSAMPSSGRGRTTEDHLAHRSLGCRQLSVALHWHTVSDKKGQSRSVQSEHRTAQQDQSSVGSHQQQPSVTIGPCGPCYGCGLTGHIRKFCPNGQQGLRAHLTPSMATTSAASPPPRGNGAHNMHNIGKVPQTAATSQGTDPRFYAMPTHPTAEASNVDIKGILTVFSLHAYALMDPGSTFSYVTPYFALDFGIEPEQLLEPFSMSTPVGDSVISSRIYKGCVIIIQDRETTTDLIELYKCYAILDCCAKVVKLEFPNKPVREWKGNIAEPRGKFISYLKEKKMITKGCLYHLVRVIDITVEVTSIQYVPIVNEFPDELSGIPPDRGYRTWDRCGARYATDIYSPVPNGSSQVKRIEGEIERFTG